MMTTRTSRGALACALLATTCLAAPALAQSAPPPSYRNVDGNGVDLVSGKMTFSLTEAVMGSGDGALGLARHWTGSGAFVDNWSSGLFAKTANGVTTWYVELGDLSDTFTQSGSAFVSNKADGATLEQISGTFRYTSADGTVIDYRDAYQLQGASCPTTGVGECYIPASITRPNGMKYTLRWDYVRKCTSGGTLLNCSTEIVTFYRFRGVTSSAGYSFTLNYLTNTAGTYSAPVSDWYKKTGVSFANASNACNGSCPSLAYSEFGGIITVTDALNRQWRFDTSTTQLTGIRRPGGTADSTSIAFGPGAIVTQVVNEGVTTSYSRALSGTAATTTITSPAGQKVVTADTAIGRITSVTDELGRKTSFSFDANGRLKRVTAPEGNYTEYTYDARGNVTQTQAVAKSGSGLAAITTSTVYPASCANQKTCNRPVSITDARGQVTDYAYDAAHGGLVSVTAPAAPNGVRPQTRYGYALAASPVSGHGGAYLLTSVSACQTAASCAGSADEVRTSIGHGANMLPVSVSSGAGDGSLTAARAMTYDAAGNLLTVDGPLAGADDTARFRYDGARQLVGSVSPDPDGAGPLRHRAVRTSYNADGQATLVENGTVTDQSDGAWAAFAPLEAVETGYDGHARPVTSKLVAGGTIHALTQVSYDALGRPECAAQRMNPAAFGALPASACTPGAEGAFGPDRIGRTIYDAAGQATQRRVAVGTADEAAEATASYRPNGQVETLTDGENNRTTYEYDGHDRLLRTFYPVAGKGAAASNGGDYEQLGYDAGSNIVSRRLRDGQTIFYGYDNLSRLTAKDLPNTATYEGDVSYGYDLLGRLTAVSDTVGHQQSFGHDALGRRLSEASNWYGTVGSAYDVAGRRTRLTWRDGFFVTYDHLVTGEMSAIREYGGFVLASFGYDDLGRRTSLTRGNGTVTGYGYDPVSRLASLTQDLAGGAHDIGLTFSYNPASQIAFNTRSNDVYAWTGHGSGTVGSTTNGLNQLVNQGGTALSHDAKGNMTFDGARSFGYTAENRLVNGPGTNPYHDALGRLFHLSGSGVNLHHDGSAMIEEALPGGHIRRFVHGPGVDEPLVWYEGAGTGDKRYLHADERGSIVAVSDNAGNALAINRYDEYGKPQAGNVGRFQYTGQVWLPEIGLYYYKARMYNPNLGRFMQTDPIGYGDGMNMYAYVGGDPVNFTDPPGSTKKLRIVCTGSRIAGACQGGGIAGGLSGSSSAGVGGQAPAPGNGVGSGGGWVKVSTPVTSKGNEITVTAASYVWVSATNGLNLASVASNSDREMCSIRSCD